MLNWHGYKMLEIAITLRISNYGGKKPSENRQFLENYHEIWRFIH